MKKITKLFKKIYKNIFYSIAFYPVLISFGFLVFALSGIAIEDLPVMQELKEEVPFLFIENVDTARTILSTIITGILSLTVFSFTMVMVVLSQASSNFSPRLLPGLVSNKRHQLILGFYIGTLLYSIIVLMAQGAYGVDTVTMGATTMFAAIFGVICVALFVSFIHSISRAIQIENIINRIFNECWEDISCEIKRVDKNLKPTKDLDTSQWYCIRIDRTGYFMGFDSSLLSDELKDRNLNLEILPYKGQHLWMGMPILYSKVELNEADEKSILFSLTMSSNRHNDNALIPGITKLMEIAVKALSPGINDPGTAVDVITKMGRLLRKSVELPLRFIEKNEMGWEIITNNVSLDVLLSSMIQPIRWYARNDRMVLKELIEALRYVGESEHLNTLDRQSLDKELEAIGYCVEHYVGVPEDKKRLLEFLEND